MLRISETSKKGEETVLRFEGEIVGPWVEVAKDACKPFLGNGFRLTLDLTDVSHVDRQGLTFLRELMDTQVMLINGSPYLTERLKLQN